MKLDEAKKFRGSCVYCLEFPNGKRYVGKTKCLRDRLGLYERFGGSSSVDAAIKEFGWDVIDIQVLSNVECSDKVDLELCLGILEVKYIRDLCTLVPNGYNVSLGGECLGIPVNYITTDTDVVKRYCDGSKVLLVYDIDGNFMDEYPSIARFAYDKGIDEDSVRNAINRKSPLYGSWYIREKRYNYIPNQIVVNAKERVKNRIVYNDIVKDRIRYRDVVKVNYIDKFVERKIVKTCHILRYDMNGDFCGEYESMKDACRSFLSTNSGLTCGVYRNGYVLFKKKDDDYPHKIEPYTILSKKALRDYYVPADELPDKDDACDGWSKTPKRRKNKVAKETKKKDALCVDGRYTNIKNSFAILQYTLDDELVAKHKSIRDAADDTGIPYANIWACVMGRTTKAKGYKWKSDDAFNTNDKNE